MEVCNWNSTIGQHLRERLWFGNATDHFNGLMLKGFQFDGMPQAIDGQFTELASGLKAFSQGSALRVQQQIDGSGPRLAQWSRRQQVPIADAHAVHDANFDVPLK